MRRYRIPISQRQTVLRCWSVDVEAETQAEAVELIETQLEDDVEPESLRGVARVALLAGELEDAEPWEVQERDITEGPCVPDPRQTTLF